MSAWANHCARVLLELGLSHDYSERVISRLVTSYIEDIKDGHWFTWNLHSLLRLLLCMYNKFMSSIQYDLFILKELYLSFTLIQVYPKQKIFQSVSLWTEVSALFNKFMSLNLIWYVSSQMTLTELYFHSGLSQSVRLLMEILGFRTLEAHWCSI